MEEKEQDALLFDVRKYFGIDTFRGLQREIIENILERRSYRRVLKLPCGSLF